MGVVPKLSVSLGKNAYQYILLPGDLSAATGKRDKPNKQGHYGNRPYVSSASTFTVLPLPAQGLVHLLAS